MVLLGPLSLSRKTLKKHVRVGLLGSPWASLTRKNTYDSEHPQEKHVKARLWGYPGASSGLLRPSGGHPGASPGLLKVSWCLRRPPARENTSPQRSFARFLRIFTSSWVYVSVSRGPRHVKTRPPNTIPSHFNGFSRRPMYLNGIPCIPASSTSAAPLHVFRRSSSSAAGDAKRPGSAALLLAAPRRAKPALRSVLESECSLLLESVALYTEAISP